MKATHIVIVALLIILGGFYWASVQKSAPTPETTQTQTETTESTEHAESAEDDSHMDMEDTAVPGNDVGMEYPTMDIEVDANAKVFNVEGFNFGYNMGEIRVQEGDTVVINFKSTDGFHDWVIDEFSVATTKVRTGDTTQVTFVADKKGTFEYYCSVGSHRAEGMVGKLVVE
jgi:plastocyanin